MELCQLLYVSRATPHIDLIEIADLANESSARNAQRGITGALLFCNGFFIQALEGDPEVVRRLYTTIARDPRHCDLHIVSQRSIRYPEFGNWGMTLLDTRSLEATRSVIEKFSNAVFAAKCTSPDMQGSDLYAILQGIDQSLLDVASAADALSPQ